MSIPTVDESRRRQPATAFLGAFPEFRGASGSCLPRISRDFSRNAGSGIAVAKLISAFLSRGHIPALAWFS
jgi:hypothetical protein